MLDWFGCEQWWKSDESIAMGASFCSRPISIDFESNGRSLGNPRALSDTFGGRFVERLSNHLLRFGSLHPRRTWSCVRTRAGAGLLPAAQIHGRITEPLVHRLSAIGDERVRNSGAGALRNPRDAGLEVI